MSEGSAPVNGNPLKVLAFWQSVTNRPEPPPSSHIAGKGRLVLTRPARVAGDKADYSSPSVSPPVRFLSAAPRMSPSDAPESDEPYCATASFSSEISRALIDRPTLRVVLSKLVTSASI